MYQYSPTHNAVFASHEPAYHWRYDTGGQINGGLAISGDALYIETFAPAVVALDRRTGRLLWRTPMPNLVMTTPIVADGLVVVGTGRDGVGLDTARRLIWSRPGGDEIVALDVRTGRIRWRHATVGENMPSPALVRIGARNAIVFANGDDQARALDLGTGRTLWNTSIDGVSTMSSAAAAGGLVYVLAGPSAASHRPDYVYALGASGGAIVWTAPYGNADVSPTVADGRVFVEDAQTMHAPAERNAWNDVDSLAASSGRLLWDYESGPGSLTRVGTSEEAIAGMFSRGVLFQSLPAARRFAAFEARTGRLLWSTRTEGAVKMSAVALDGRLYVGDTAGILYTLDDGNGRVIARRRFAQPFTCSSPVAVGSTIYLADDASVFALPLAATPRPLVRRGRSVGPREHGYHNYRR